MQLKSNPNIFFSSKLPDVEKNMLEEHNSIKQAILRYHEERMDKLDKESSKTAAGTEEKTTLALKKIEHLQNLMNSSGSPQMVNPDAKAYQLVAKVIAEETRLGLRNLIVRLVCSHDRKRLADFARTDEEGNAVFYMEEDKVEELAKENTILLAEIVTSEEKPVQVHEHLFTPRLNHVDTLLLSLPSSKNIGPHIEEANRIKMERQLLMTDLTERIKRLKDAHDMVQQKMVLKLETVRSVIAAIKGERVALPKKPVRGVKPPRTVPGDPIPEAPHAREKAKEETTETEPTERMSAEGIVKMEKDRAKVKKKATRKELTKKK